MSIILCMSNIYIYIYSIYLYLIDYIRPFNKNLEDPKKSCDMIDEIEDGLKNSKNLDIHYHFHYVKFDDVYENNPGFKSICVRCHKNTKRKICYVAYDKIFCSINCQNNWIKYVKSINKN